jgi:peptide/nickel transport system permease protein
VKRFFAARLLQSLIVLFLVTTISFVIIHAVPGDPFSYDSPNVPPAVKERLRHEYGYDRPLAVQYVRYIGNVARGNLGYSVSRRENVASAIASALPNTLLLMSVALTLSFAIGIALGATQAAWRDTWFDRSVSATLMFFYSLPDFWLALAILLGLTYWLPLFPSGGVVDVVMHDYLPFWGRVLDRLKHLVLPATTLVLLTAAAIARYQRAAMLEVLPLDFVRTARAKGVPERQVLGRHALRNALLPTVTLIGIVLPTLVGGTVFVEKIFTWPGMGLLTVNAIDTRDYDLVLAGVILGGIMVAIGNLLSDVLYAVVDPRIRE